MADQFLKFRDPNSFQSKTEFTFDYGDYFLGTLLDIQNVLCGDRSVLKIPRSQLFPLHDFGDGSGFLGNVLDLWDVLYGNTSVPKIPCSQLFPKDASTTVHENLGPWSY